MSAITVKNFVEDFASKKIMNTKIAPDAVSNFIKEKLEIRTYVPFVEKRKIIETIVDKNTTEIDGCYRNDSIGQYVAFVIAMIMTHSTLEFDVENPINDYDILCQTQLLMPIIETFKDSYDECNTLLKMAVAQKLEENNLNIIVAKFFGSLLNKIDSFEDVIKEKVGDLDLKDFLGADIKQEDITKVLGFMDKLNK